MMAAQYSAWFWVVAGTTLRMLLAKAPVVRLGKHIPHRVPMRTVHGASALIFLVLGVR